MVLRFDDVKPVEETRRALWEISCRFFLGAFVGFRVGALNKKNCTKRSEERTNERQRRVAYHRGTVEGMTPHGFADRDRCSRE